MFDEERSLAISRSKDLEFKNERLKKLLDYREAQIQSLQDVIENLNLKVKLYTDQFNK